MAAGGKAAATKRLGWRARAARRQFDSALIISADGDLTPAVKAASETSEVAMFTSVSSSL
jgi:uncharacterized LabA/DUF88 family protein